MDSTETQAELEASQGWVDSRPGMHESTQPDRALAHAAVAREAFLRDLWRQSGGEAFGLSEAAFVDRLLGVGAKHNYGAAPGEPASAAQREAFLRALHVQDLALARACAQGSETAWKVFLEQYQAALTRAAVGMTRSSALGEDLAGSLYAELFGLTERDGVRRSPLASYSGRGSLMGWLRTMLAQRHVDHHRRTHRETPMEREDVAAPMAEAVPASPALATLDRAITVILRTIPPEERYLLSSYFLDGSTLLEIARILHVHEATVSRKLKRLTTDLRKRLVRELERSGLSRRAAEEALGTDPRDLTVNLRNLLQASARATFPAQEGAAS